MIIAYSDARLEYDSKLMHSTEETLVAPGDVFVRRSASMSNFKVLKHSNLSSRKRA
jgi:hypothetical protein